jgi:F-type H+-transporting ATPase subunit a
MELNISLAPQVIFEIAGFPVTNTLIWTIFISLFLIAITLLVSKRLKDVPGTLQNIVELLIEMYYNFVKSVIGTDERAKKIFPLVMTMFIFTLVCNLAVYIPGQAAIALHKADGMVPVFRAVMSDYGMVFVMTMISIIIMHIVAIIVHGPFGYLKKFITFKSPLAFILGIMDIISEIAKIISLSFRLFGNIFAGEVLGAVMLFLAPFILPLPFMFLGLLTAVVQAFVFSVLTLVFITLASEIDEDPTVEAHSI